MEEQASLNGTINRFFYQDVESGYMVFVLDIQQGQPVTVRGKFPPLLCGQDVELMGRWVVDPKYGRQFEAVSCHGILPSSPTGLKRFLGSGIIKGIGKAYAQKLVEYFGTDVLAIIDKQPERLIEVSGLGEKRAALITDGWHAHKEVAEVMVFLQDKGVSSSLATRIHKQYKHNTVAYLAQNPYRIAEEVWGIGFKTADEIAQKFGCALDSPQRITAGVLFALLTASYQGHLYSEMQDLKKSVHDLLGLTPDEKTAQTLKMSLHQLYEQGKIQLVTRDNQHFLTTTRCFNAETQVAKKLRALMARPSILTFDNSQLYRKLSSQQGRIALNDRQIEGILTSLANKVTIITGGPGTGKTTLIRALLKHLEDEHVVYKLAAPTGRAAKRITEGTSRPAATLHRLLDFDPIGMGFKYNEANALPLQFLIIDEASMIDIFLANAVIKALPLDAHVLFIGDIDQLPSVGAGNFLNDCIASKLIPCMRLTEVFRQAQDSLIIANAHRVNKGEFPVTFIEGSRQDFQFIKEADATALPKHLKRILFTELAKYRIPISDAIVLSPMNRGSAGTVVLNQHLQLLLNPGVQDQVTFNGTCFKVGDRVMQIRNNYDKFVFNGDIGTIESVDIINKSLAIAFGERVHEYDFTDLNEIVLAYAVSIHKSQGSEYPAVIIPLFCQHFTLLQRNLVYTAITRARLLCILIGEPKALAMALSNNKSTHRITFLKVFLQEGA